MQGDIFKELYTNGIYHYSMLCHPPVEDVLHTCTIQMFLETIAIISRMYPTVSRANAEI